jgi:hypothetical protein
LRYVTVVSKQERLSHCLDSWFQKSHFTAFTAQSVCAVKLISSHILASCAGFDGEMILTCLSSLFTII